MQMKNAMILIFLTLTGVVRLANLSPNVIRTNMESLIVSAVTEFGMIPIS